MKILYTFSLATFFCLSSFAETKSTITLGTHYSPPWSDGKCSGAEIDTIKEAFSFSNITVKCKYYSYARLVKSFRGKEIDFASPITKLDGDTSGAIYSDPFHKYVDVAISYSPEKTDDNIFLNKRVVAYQGASKYLGDKYNKLISSAQSYEEISGRDSQIQMLDKKRIDFVVGEHNILHSLAFKHNSNKKVYTNKVFKKWDIRAASFNKELVQKFNSGLLKLKKSGRLDQIFKQYKIILE